MAPEAIESYFILLFLDRDFKGKGLDIWAAGVTLY